MTKRAVQRKRSTSSSAASVIDNRQKVCICCYPEEALHPLSDYFASINPLHADGLVPICKKCIVQHSFDYKTNHVDIEKFIAVLQQIDRPYLPEIMNVAWKEFDDVYNLSKVREPTRIENLDKVILYYFKALLQSPTYRHYHWRDGIISIDEEVSEQSGNSVKQRKAKNNVVTDDMRIFWGPGFANDDYIFLQHEFDEWVKDQGGMPDSKSQIEILKNLCMSRLQTLRGMVSGDGNMSATLKSFNESLTLGNLKPTEKKSGTENPLGVVIRDITNFTPPDFYKDKELFRDYSGIEEYIERFVLRPMRNTMFGEREEDKEFTVMDSDDTAE